MICNRKMLLALICVCCSFCLAAGVEQQEVPGNFADPCAVKEISERKDTANNLPRWIEKEKIRSGWVSSENNTQYVDLLKSAKMNTLILKSHFHHKNKYHSSLRNLRQWAQVCKQQSLHVLVAYLWQPNRSDFQYGKVVYANGDKGIAPCPRNTEYWQNYLIRFGKDIATLSLEDKLSIDGIFIDTELYGSGRYGFKNYGKATCFCDDCFSDFLFAQGYTPSQLPTIPRSARKNWLSENKLLSAYFNFLQKDVETLARKLREQIHSINPSLLIGIYPTPKDWVRKSLVRGLGTPNQPILLFATDTYAGSGYEHIPSDPIKFYRGQGINCRYVAGFLLSRYGYRYLEPNIYEAAKKCDGYWLFRMRSLWKPEKHDAPLKFGSPEQYWLSIKKANEKINNLAP